MFGSPSSVDLALFAIGWTIGWLLLWRSRPLRPAHSGATPRQRPSIAVVIPARNEAPSIGGLVAALVPQLRDGDELIVADDGSDDDTARRAARAGARVIAVPPPPPGWLGKPHACWTASRATSATILVFVDADVRPAADLLDLLAVEVADVDDDVVSVQPWHATGGVAEQASTLFNVTSLMASGGFTVLGDRLRPSVAFGPVLALHRSTYERIGGHADPTIRTMHTEDIGIARAVGRVRLRTGGPGTTFRMYPRGFRQTVDGWTRSIASGARFTNPLLAILTAAWVASLAGGWLAAPIVYPLCAAQVWILGRRAVSIHPITALVYPLAVAVFGLVFLRSAGRLVRGADVEWKGRRVAAR